MKLLFKQRFFRGLIAMIFLINSVRENKRQGFYPVFFYSAISAMVTPFSPSPKSPMRKVFILRW